MVKQEFWTVPQFERLKTPDKMHSYSAVIVAALVLLQPATASPRGNHHGSPPPPSATCAPFLNELAQQHGKLWFGTAADIPGTNETSDEGYMAIVTNEKIFGELTPANMMKVCRHGPSIAGTATDDCSSNSQNPNLTCSIGLEYVSLKSFVFFIQAEFASVAPVLYSKDVSFE